MAKIIAFRKSAYRSWEEVLDAFLLFRKALGNSPRTLGDYRQHVGFFFRSYPTVHDTESWGGIALRDSLLDHMGALYSTPYLQFALSSLRNFLASGPSREGCSPKTLRKAFERGRSSTQDRQHPKRRSCPAP